LAGLEAGAKKVSRPDFHKAADFGGEADIMQAKKFWLMPMVPNAPLRVRSSAQPDPP
jgi:hypothetical protein